MEIAGTKDYRVKECADQDKLRLKIRLKIMESGAENIKMWEIDREAFVVGVWELAKKHGINPQVPDLEAP